MNLYSIERTEVHDNICWQQLEGIKENVLRLTASKTRRDRRIISLKYQTWLREMFVTGRKRTNI